MDVIILRPLSVVQIHKTNAINSINNGQIMIKFFTKIFHIQNKIPKSALMS